MGAGLAVSRADDAPAARSPVIRSFAYYGGKTRHLSFVLRALPRPSPALYHFVDAFGGSGVLTANVAYAVRTYNDRNGRLVGFFRVLRERPGDLLAALELTPYSRAEYAAAATPAPVDFPGDREVEDARRFLVRLLMGIQAMPSGAGCWSASWSTPRRKIRPYQWAHVVPPKLVALAARFRDVQVEAGDALAVVRRADLPHVVIYLDPPYPTATRAAPGAYGAYEMSAGDHERLAAALREIKHAKVALSSYASPIYDALGWRRLECETVEASRSRSRSECLYVNYDPPDRDLFGAPRRAPGEGRGDRLRA